MEKIGLQAILETSSFQSGLKTYLSGIGQMESKSAGLGTKIAGNFKSIGTAVIGAGAAIGVAAAAAGAAIGAFTVSGIQKAADLESQLSSIAATLNMTKEQVAPLNDLILQLGLDPNLKVSATEAATAIENLAKNGLSMTQIIDGAARSTVLLANATGADFGMAADIATDTMALFNIKAEDMARAVDQITGVTNASKFTIDDYRLALAQGGGVASAVGVEFEDFNTTIAAISPLFASGSDAGTSYKTMLLNMIPKSDEAAAAMKELGLMTADGANQFFDANGQLKSMADISEILNGALTGLSEEQKNNALATIFGTDAMRAAVGVADSGAVVYKTAAEAAKALGVSIETAATVAEGGITKFEAMQLQIGKIDASEQAATRMNNFKGALEILGGAIDTLQIQIGQAFLPILTALAKKATELVSAWGPTLVEAFEKVSTAIGTFFTALGEGQTPLDAFKTSMGTFGESGTNIANAMGAAVLAVGGFLLVIGTITQPIIDIAGKFVEWKDVLIVLAGAVAFVVIPAIYAMLAAIAPIALTLAGAVLAVAALRTAWENDWLGIQTKTTEAIGAIQAAFSPFTAAIAAHGRGALAEIKAFASGNQTEFTNVQAIWEGAKTSVSNLFAGIVASVTEHLPTWRANLTEWGTVAVQWITDAAAQVATYVNNYVTTLTAEVTAKLPTWKAELTKWGEAAWQWIIDASTEVTAKVGVWYTRLVSQLMEKLPSFKTEMLKWAAGLVEWIIDAAADPLVNLGKWLGKVVAWIPTGLSNLKSEMIQMATGLLEWIGGKASSDAPVELGKWMGKVVAWIPLGVAKLAIEAVKLVGALIGWIAGNWGGAPGPKDAVSQVDPEMEKLKTALVNAIKAVGVAFIQAGEAFVEEFGKTISEHVDWKQLGNDLMTAIWNGVESVKALVTDTFAALVDSVVALITETDWLGLGAGIITKLNEGVSSMVGAVTTAIGEITTAIINGLKGILDDVFQIGKDIIGSIGKGFDEAKSALIEKIKEFADLLPQWLKDALGMHSPSPFFVEIGRDIMRSLIIGMENESRNLQQAINNIVANVQKAAMRVGVGAANSISSTIGNLFSSSSTILDELGRQLEENNLLWMDLMNYGLYDLAAPFKEKGNRLVGLKQEYAAQQKNYELLKQQADLIQAIRDAGGNPAEVLAGVQLGLRQNPINRQIEYDAEGMTKAIIKMTEALNSELLQSVQAAAVDVEETISRIASLRRPVDDLERAFNVSGRSSVDDYRLRMADLDEQIRATEEALRAFGDETVSARNMPGIQGTISIKRSSVLRALTNKRNEILADYEMFLRQQSQVEEAMKGIVNRGDSGFLQKFTDSQIQPWIDFFNDALSEGQRAAAVTTIERRVDLLNQMSEMLEELDLLGGSDIVKKFREDTLDPLLTAFSSTTMGDSDRQNIITSFANNLDNLIETVRKTEAMTLALERLKKIQQDLTIGVSADPIAARFKSERLDTIAKQLENINLAEAERFYLIEQYRHEQEKILRIQEKQQQLTFLEQQLSLIEKLRALDDEANELDYNIYTGDILEGIEFGVNASIDDLMRLLSSVIDETIKLTNKKLGIASPSKVFAKIGSQLMEGLAMGINSAKMQPILSIQQATQQLPYSVSQRSTTLNMNGWNINNGMDQTVAEQWIRQTVEGML